jgi:hypothetical protein
MSKRLTTEEFKLQLSKEHPELELLSDYNGNKNYITVKCVKHDYIFNTKPNWLHAGTGCQKCYDERRGESLRKSVDTFIEESRKIHNDKYDYSKVEYTGNKDKVCIICPEHGEFWQTPNKHLSGQGCPKCAGKHITTDEWINKASEMHQGRYDYSKVEYINNSTKVCIICPEHGEFWQTPDKHLGGEGCPICNNSKMELSMKKTLDENSIKYEQQKQFDWLGKQKLDFYLPEYNVGIECQGRQHFIEIPHFDGKNGLRIRIIRDITKNNLCNENGVKLFYVINEKDIELAKKKIFLDIYNKENIIVSEKINKIKNILNS